MANPLTRFNLTPISRNSAVEFFDYIPHMAPVGDFKRIENIDVIINSWSNILLTPRGSYDHDPQYGSGLYNLIFEPATTNTRQLIINEINNSLKYYDNRATIKKIDVSFINSTKKGFNVDIQVSYNGEIKPLTLNIVQAQ